MTWCSGQGVQKWFGRCAAATAVAAAQRPQKAEYDYYGITETADARTIIIMKAMDGKLYRFIEQPELASEGNQPI